MHRIYSLKTKKIPRWVDILIVTFGIIGYITFVRLYDRALPSASVDVSISRAQAEEIATSYLQELGYNPSGYESVLSFAEESSPLYYLQRTLGVEESNQRLVDETLPTHYWYMRWFKPLEKEEFSVFLTPVGDFMGFRHIIAEDALGADVPQEEAALIAENYLKEYVNWQPTAWQEVEASSTSRPGGRVDHYFAWKAKDFNAAEAELRYSVTIQGDSIGSINHWVKVPENFMRDFAQERENANILNMIAFILGLIGFFMVSMVALQLFNPDLKIATRIGSIVGIVTLASQLNSLVTYPLSYDTTQNYTYFWTLAIISIILGAISYAYLIAFAYAGGQSFSKIIWSHKDRLLTRGPDRWLTFSRSAWRGLFFAGIQLSYVVLFYLFTDTQLGWWSPVTAEYSDIFSTPFPFLIALRVGLWAAISEELLFRMVGITFFLWLFKKKHTWAALLIPGILWAFAHSSYVTYPIYARGIELIPVAIYLGIIFLKFDLLTAIMSHFTYNMMIVGIILLRASETYYVYSGLVVVVLILLPLLPGLFIILKRRIKKENPIPDELILSDATPDDLPHLQALPIKADWETLLRQPGRHTLVLRAENELVGVTTGIQKEQIATLDGIYVAEKWRRQFWASKMTAAFSEAMQKNENTTIRTVITDKESELRNFFNGQLWLQQAIILKKRELPTPNALIKKSWRNFINTFKKKKAPEAEPEFPRTLC